MFGFGIEIQTSLPVDENDELAPENFPDEVPQLEYSYNWISEGIMFPNVMNQFTQDLCRFQKQS